MSFGIDDLLNAQNKVVGTKQTLKALEKKVAVAVFLAKDAEDKVIGPIMEMCRVNNIYCGYVDTMAELGKVCAIKVGAAAVAIVKK